MCECSTFHIDWDIFKNIPQHRIQRGGKELESVIMEIIDWDSKNQVMIGLFSKYSTAKNSKMVQGIGKCNNGNN